MLRGSWQLALAPEESGAATEKNLSRRDETALIIGGVGEAKKQKCSEQII